MHGTKSAYNHMRCRCEACRRANADYRREWRASHRSGPPKGRGPGRPLTSEIRASLPQPPLIPLAERFWTKVRKSDGCWEWTGSRSRQGYGRVYVDRTRRHEKAHRIAYELAVGAIPEGQWVLHRCDNPPCVRPDHLFLGDRRDNMRDAATKGRLLSQARPERTARGERVASSKLSTNDVREVRRRVAAGESQTSIAQAFGLRPQSVSKIVRRLLWAHICVLVATLAITALLSTSSRAPNSGQTSEVEGSAVRAALGEPEAMPALESPGMGSPGRGPSPDHAPAEDGLAQHAGDGVQVAARTTTAIDEMPGSAPVPLTTQASLDRRDPALVVRASPVPRSLVVDVGRRYGIDGDRFADVMFCESSFRPDAIGDGGRAWGIAQFHAPTWAASSRRYYGMELAPAMRLDPDLALLVAARKWAAEGPWAWSCAK